MRVRSWEGEGNECSVFSSAHQHSLQGQIYKKYVRPITEYKERDMDYFILN